MSELEQISEEIRRVMETLHEAYKTSHEAEENLTEETLNALQKKLRKLHEELETVEWLEAHASSVVMEHFQTAISEWVLGRKAGHQRSPKLPPDSQHESTTDNSD